MIRILLIAALVFYAAFIAAFVMLFAGNQNRFSYGFYCMPHTIGISEIINGTEHNDPERWIY